MSESELASMDGKQLILLYMWNKLEGERSIAGCYHMLTGKKSAQSIQDAWLYGFSSWYGLFSDWSKPVIQSVEQAVQERKIELKEVIQLLQPFDFENRAFLAKQVEWTGMEAVSFSKKFRLLSQVVSHYLTNQPKYIPVIKDIKIQQAVKHFWQSLADKYTFSRQFRHEIYGFLEQLEDDLLATLVVERLSGYQIYGKTFQQLASKTKIPEAILELYYYQVMLLLMEFGRKHKLSFLPLIGKGEKRKALTSSAQKTYHLLKKGYDVAEISKRRQLKENTIEDHLIEIAIHLNDVDFSRFVSAELMAQVLALMDRLKTRKLSLLKEHFPSEISYFQLRLALVLARKKHLNIERFSGHETDG